MNPSASYLLIDVGNSRVKYGCHGNGRWLLREALVWAAERPLALPADFVPSRIVIANVAGEEVAGKLAAWLTPWEDRVEWLRGSTERCGLRCDYEDPTQLGTDRWAAAIGAWQAQRRDCVVVCAGTATTVDVILGNGHHAGGCILPGLTMMMEALSHGTARLPFATGRLAMPPRNTHDAIVTGCLQAQAGAIERMQRQLAPTAPVLLAGGNAELLAPLLGGPVELMPWLVLEGLLAVAREPGPA